MKTIAPAAMAAIEAGEAIVTGAVAILPGAIGGTATLAAIDAVWKYKQEAPGSAADYSSGSYDDTAWASANGAFSNQAPLFGDPYNTTIFGGVSPIAAGSAIWIRKSLGALAALPITLYVTRDDGAAAWFNGTAIALTTIDYYHAQATIGSGLVNVSGPNVLAVKVTDSVPGGSPVGIFAGASLTQALPGATGTPIRVWGGYGPLVIDGETYEGIGARGLAQQNAGAVGGTAQGLMLTLSGLEAAALELLDADELKRAPTVLYRLIFAGDGKTLLDAHVWDRGRVDTIGTDEEIGGEAAIQLAVESAARGLGRSGGRRRSDSDQRLINPTDGYFKHTAFAGQKTLYWGGKTPSFGTTSGSTAPSAPRKPLGSFY